MNDWREVTLAEVASDVTVGHVGPMAKHYIEDGIPFLRSLNVNPHCINLRDVKYISAEFHAKLGKSALSPGDVVTVRTGKPGTTSVIPEELPIANCSDLVITRPGPDLDAWWFSYYMNSTASDFIDSQLVGAVQQHFNVGSAKAMKINLPPLPYQEAVVEVLRALDDKIAANTKFAVTVDSFLAALFQKLTQDASALPLGDVATVNPAASKPVPGGSLRYIDISSVGQGTFDFPDISAWDDAPSRARRHVQRGDTLWSTVRPNRRSHALVLSDDDLLVGSTGLAILRPGEVGFAYLYEATKTTEFTAYLENVAEGSAYPAVRANRFVDAPIKWATAPERQSFETVAAPLRQTVQSLTEENLTLAATRDALLPQLMSGKLRVKEAEKVLESAL